MKEIQKITIIGAGCVAKFFAAGFVKRGLEVVEIVARREKVAQELAKKVKARASTDFSQINQESDLYLISVKDDSIKEVTPLIKLQDKLIVHTSGTLPIDVLKDCSSRYGVIYPLQSIIERRKLDFSKIPFFINANVNNDKLALESFMMLFSNSVQTLDDEKRAKLHLSAVFVSNFTNYMLKVANDITDEIKLEFDVLRPLAEETISKAFDITPEFSQTGPAKRGDSSIVKAHAKMLKGKRRELYELVSYMIKTDYDSFGKK